MKFIPLHTKNTTIVYKNALCSSAFLIVLILITLSVMIPILLVSLLSPYSGIAESRVLYEQPNIKFKHQYIFMGVTQQQNNNYNEEIPSNIIACSTFANFKKRMQNFAHNCATVKYWNEDKNNDDKIDHIYFQLQLDALSSKLSTFDLIIFFDAELTHKCNLSPPAILAKNFQMPLTINHGQIVFKAELQLKQYIEFYCPFPGRNLKTKFHPIHLPPLNETDTLDLKKFQLEELLRQTKHNSAYFQLDVQETYIKPADPYQSLTIELQLHIVQVPARYHLSVWERLGQFWLYFASFFGISFYIMNKLKDFLFGRRIIRAWEVIPWKKLY